MTATNLFVFTPTILYTTPQAHLLWRRKQLARFPDYSRLIYAGAADSAGAHSLIYSTYVYAESSGVRAITAGKSGDAFIARSSGRGFPITANASPVSLPADAILGGSTLLLVFA
jgi:hypothetical protein